MPNLYEVTVPVILTVEAKSAEEAKEQAEDAVRRHVSDSVRPMPRHIQVVWVEANKRTKKLQA